MKSFTLVLVIAAQLFRCDPDTAANLPTCMNDLIHKSTSLPKEVWRYTYQKQTVFLVVPDCCDQYISVYSTQCSLICSPSGGITGQGDGKCPEFYQEAKEGLLIWKAEQ
jgi:hypothetical protein